MKSIKFSNQYYLEMFFLGFELLTAAFKQNNASFQTINSGRISRNRTIICEGCKVYRIGSITTNKIQCDYKIPSWSERQVSSSFNRTISSV